jgi:hypothetical protein
MNLGGLPIGWSFFSYLAVVIATAALLHYLRRLPRFFSLISLPGTVGHDLLHFLVGTLDLAENVRLIRKRPQHIFVQILLHVRSRCVPALRP